MDWRSKHDLLKWWEEGKIQTLITLTQKWRTMHKKEDLQLTRTAVPTHKDPQTSDLHRGSKTHFYRVLGLGWIFGMNHADHAAAKRPGRQTAFDMPYRRSRSSDSWADPWPREDDSILTSCVHCAVLCTRDGGRESSKGPISCLDFW